MSRNPRSTDIRNVLLPWQIGGISALLAGCASQIIDSTSPSRIPSAPFVAPNVSILAASAATVVDDPLIAPTALPVLPVSDLPSLNDCHAACPPTVVDTEPPKIVLDRGLASWYGSRFHGRRTASGERFDRYAFTAAHRTLPFGLRVRVRDVDTGKTVVVRINDRGPLKTTRIIDLSEAAMSALGPKHRGLITVELSPE